MRVGVRIAVAGKMFRAGQHVLALHSADERAHVTADLLRIFAEAARVDHRIVGIDIHISDGRQDVIDAQRARLARHHSTLLFRERRIAGRGDRHGRWPEGRVAESHADAGLQVGAD